MHRYEEISEAIQRELQLRGAGARLSSFRTLMRRFRCSQATINRALRNLEDGGLLRRRPGSGIYADLGANPARTAAIGTVEFLVPSVGNRACALLLRGGELAARARGLRVAVHPYGDQFPQGLDLPPGTGGLVILARSVDVDQGLVKPVLDALPPNVRCVLVDVDSPGRRGPFVGLDDFAAGARAGEAFKGRGTRRVACLGTAGSHPERSRIAGLTSAMGRPPETFLEFPDLQHFDRKAVARLIETGIDGLFVARPDMTVQTLVCLDALGVRIPEDLFVIAVAEEEDNRAYPFPVMVVVKATREVGREAVRALYDNAPVVKRLGYRVRAPS